MSRLHQFSTGVASAEVALADYDAHGPDGMVLITANTLEEHPDNWRFAFEVVERMPGVTWIVLTDGRTPMEVGRDERVIPNNRMAVCSKILKRKLIRRYLDEHHDPPESLVYLGYDYFEADRIDAAVAHWRPWTTTNPLHDRVPALPKHALLEHMRDVRGIEPPWLYTTGAPHANCGGACVRGGQVEWRRLLFNDRPRYLRWEAEEEASRALLGDYSILRDRRSDRDEGTALPLREFRLRLEGNASLFDAADLGACGCDPWRDETPVVIGLGGVKVALHSP